jgi:lysine-N-methylase
VSIAKLYQPQYFKDFKCVGFECGNNCCHGWTITIDKKTYEKYKAIPDEAFRKRLMGCIEAVDEGDFYAVIKLNGDGNCPLLLSDGLCEVHCKLGHEGLSNTCRSYPRILCNVGGEAEAFLTMSCEAAADIALFNQSILALEETGIDPGMQHAFNHSLEIDKYTSAENGPDIFWELRSAVIFIIQNRRYPVWLRMVILGFFIKAADELIQANKEDEIAALSEGFISRIDAGLYDAYLKNIPERPDIKIAFVFSILDQLDKASPGSRQLFRECVAQMREGLGLSVGVKTVKEVTDIFSGVFQNFYSPFFKGREYIFENYIANTVYMTGFPFTYGGEGRLYGNYLKLVVKYALVKFLLIGMAGYYKQDFDKNTVIKGITAFSRLFEHNASIVTAIADELDERGAATVGALCVLIKD